MSIYKRVIRYVKIKSNPELSLKAKAQQVKNSFVSNNDNLPPDKYYCDNVDCRYIRKYNCDGIIRNSVHMGEHQIGQLRVSDNTRGKLVYSVGVRGEKMGTLKLYLQDTKYRKLILHKDIVNLLDGWNDFTYDTDSGWCDLIWDYQGDGEVFLSVDITPRTNDKVNIVVVVLDGVRQETLERCCNNINTYFKHSRKFINAYVQGEWTMPNFVSMVTGLYNTHHGVVDPDLYLKGIPDNTVTVSEHLQKEGFNTMSYFGHNRVSAGFGHSRGYNQCMYRCTFDEHSQSNSKEFVNDVRVTDIQRKQNTNLDIVVNSIKFLKDNMDTDNFLFLHVFDTHRPFFQTNTTYSDENISIMNGNPVGVLSKDNMTQEDIKYIKSIHEQKLREVDSNLGLLFDYIEKYENEHTIVILTSDHGNIFYDDGIDNVLPFNRRERFLKPNLLRVPLYIRDNKYDVVSEEYVEANRFIYQLILFYAGLEDNISIKNYTISESNFMDIYEVVYTDEDGQLYYRCKRDRKTGEIDYSNVDDERLISIMKGERLWQ